MNNFDKKVIFFDVDGTLVNSKTMKVEPSTIEILKELNQREDIDLYISSGRTYAGLFEIENILKYFTGFNLANGSQIIVNNDTIYLDPIDSTIINKLLDELDEKNVSYVLLENDYCYKRYTNEELAKVFDNVVRIDHKRINNHQGLKLDKIIEAWILDEHPLINELIKKYPDLTFYKWGNYGCDLVKKDASKGKGIKKIIELLGYDYYKTYAIGDADNDVPMLESVYYPIAMGQGNDNVKKVAKYITKPVDEDGLAYAIKKWIL